MLASEMILKLQELVETHGDLLVVDALYNITQDTYYHHPCSIEVSYVEGGEHLVTDVGSTCAVEDIPVIISYIGTPVYE